MYPSYHVGNAGIILRQYRYRFLRIDTFFLVSYSVSGSRAFNVLEYFDSDSFGRYRPSLLQIYLKSSVI